MWIRWSWRRCSWGQASPAIPPYEGLGYTAGMTETAKSQRRRFQYSLRTLFLVMFLACIGMSWVGVKMQQARRQREAVAAILRVGGFVWYDYQVDSSGMGIQGAQPPGPKWLRSLLGDDLFTAVAVVQFQRKVTDAGLEPLERLPYVHTLGLSATQTTDAALKHLRGLKQLHTLVLDGTQVIDAGLGHLKGLAQLRVLWLSNTRVTDAGLERLKGLTKLEELKLDNTQVTDAGLEHLKRLPQLCTLSLEGTKVTDEGVKKLQQALPNCEIVH